MMRLVGLTALLLAAAGCTAAGERPERSPRAEAALAKALFGLKPGKPQSCVSLSQIRGNQIIDRNTILFEGLGGRVWRNDPPRGCAGLAPGRAIVTRSSLTQHCSGDIFEIIDPPAPMTYGSCSFGQFVPYEKPRS